MQSRKKDLPHEDCHPDAGAFQKVMVPRCKSDSPIMEHRKNNKLME